MKEDDTLGKSATPKHFSQPRPKSVLSDTIDQPAWRDAHPDEVMSGDAVLSYGKDGVDERTLRRLRAGKFPVQATLDLHGTTVDAARAILAQFMMRHSIAQRVCVCIIHGKGQRSGNMPVLKSHVNRWLRQCDAVVAFTSAPPRLGGAGAVLVLIK